MEVGMAEDVCKRSCLVKLDYFIELLDDFMKEVSPKDLTTLTTTIRYAANAHLRLLDSTVELRALVADYYSICTEKNSKSRRMRIDVLRKLQDLRYFVNRDHLGLT